MQNCAFQNKKLETTRIRGKDSIIRVDALPWSNIAVTTFASFPISSSGNCFEAGAQILSIFVKTSSLSGALRSAKTRPSGTPSAVLNKITRIPPFEQLTLSMIWCNVFCRFAGRSSTVFAMIAASIIHSMQRVYSLVVMSCLLF